MTETERVIKGLEVCTTRPCYCTECPYKANCCLDSQELMEDALALVKKQNDIIEKYHRADGFLDAHGWKWEGRRSGNE